MKTPDKEHKEHKGKSKPEKTAVHTPVPPQVQYPLEKPDSKKNQAGTASSKAKK